MILAILLSCRHDTPDTGPVADTAVEEPPEEAVPIRYSLERVLDGTIPEAGPIAQALVNPQQGVSYALPEASDTVYYFLESGVYPAGDYCVGGTEDEDGNCRGGVIWTSGRIESGSPTEAMCLDRDHGELFLIKKGGTSFEVIDVATEGTDAYTYQRAVRNPKVPEDVGREGAFTGPCDYNVGDQKLVITAPDAMVIASVTTGTDPSSDALRSLGWTVGGLAVSGDRVLAWDSTGSRVSALRRSDFQDVGAYSPTGTISSFAVERNTGYAWIGLGSEGVERVGFDDAGAATSTHIDVTGTVTQLVADPSRGIAWAAVERDGASLVVLLQDGAVRGEEVIAGTRVTMGEPSATGDVPVFYTASSDGGTAYTMLGPVENRQVLDPLRIFLFTTIEEPSDANFDVPCTGAGTTFDTELALVRENASAIVALGVPVAMAITDNFAEKAELCGQTAIYQELADMGIELGAMLHNRPCYNCTSAGGTANPDLCSANDADYIASSSENACFPDDPDYCGIGDWDCYLAFLAPRVDVADRNIPGGARFIVGGDRHGMWQYDWIRLYREVERPTMGLVGFDLTMFAGTWAYNDIDYDDGRGKNPSPWHVDRRAAAWHLADIDHWDQDSPTSDLFYLPGPNSSTVKIGEQQASGLYMLDYFDVASSVAYRPDDFEAQWQSLRSAIANRRPGNVNTWYFHVHDTGTVNVRDQNGNSVSTDLDGEGGEDPVTVESMLVDFVAQIESRYGESGEIEWMYPTEIKALDTR